jgi:hypothetical protein
LQKLAKKVEREPNIANPCCKNTYRMKDPGPML